MFDSVYVCMVVSNCHQGTLLYWSSKYQTDQKDEREGLEGVWDQKGRDWRQMI
jgi:hypothetical protein